jgi:hypothetical protein
MEIFHYVLIYLSISIILFSVLFYRRLDRFLKIKNKFFFVLRLALFSLFFGLLIPFIILNPEILASYSGGTLTTSSEAQKETTYTQSDEYDKDWSIIAGMLLGFFSVIFFVCYLLT